MGLKLKDLVTPEGIQALVNVTGGTDSYYNHPEQAADVQAVVAKVIEKNPHMAHLNLRIEPDFPNAQYNYEKGEVVLGVVNPHALAHELAHANNIGQNTLYAKVLNVASTVSKLNNLAAIPTVLALRVFINDPEKRKDIFNTLTALGAAAATPGLVEEASASTQAIAGAPNKLQGIKTLGPAYLSHAAKSTLPSLIYQAGRLI